MHAKQWMACHDVDVVLCTAEAMLTVCSVVMCTVHTDDHRPPPIQLQGSNEQRRFHFHRGRGENNARSRSRREYVSRQRQQLMRWQTAGLVKYSPCHSRDTSCFTVCLDSTTIQAAMHRRGCNETKRDLSSLSPCALSNEFV
jgi:hypothetical protein